MDVISMHGYKVNCPYHQDSTASCHVYPDGKYFCFGCGAKGLSDKLIVKESSQYPFKNYKENLEATLRYISTLPKKEIRGLLLPYDRVAYYVVYPLGNYYLKRLLNPSAKGGKYLGPRGHTKPVYRAFMSDYTDTLVLIEGQLNAASVVTASNYSIASPGAATDFNRKHTVEYCLQYDKIVLIVDKDAAGVAAGIQLQQTLRSRGKQCVIHAMEIDLNEVLCANGQEAVSKEIETALELLKVPSRGLHMQTLREGTSQNDT